MEFLVQILFSISKNLNFYLKVQTHTDQCDREYMTQHQIQGKVRNNLPPIPKKSQKCFGGTRTHSHTFRGAVICHLSHERKFFDFRTREVRQYLYPFSSVGSSRWSGQIRKNFRSQMLQWLGWSLHIIYCPPDFFSQSHFFHTKVHESFALISIGNQPWNRVVPR